MKLNALNKLITSVQSADSTPVLFLGLGSATHSGMEIGVEGMRKYLNNSIENANDDEWGIASLALPLSSLIIDIEC